MIRDGISSLNQNVLLWDAAWARGQGRIGIDFVPVLLGQGVRLFEYLGIEPVELEIIEAQQAPGVIHLSFRVVK